MTLTADTRTALRQLIDARRRELAPAPICPYGFGSETGYKLRGCRCELCKAAAAAARRRRRLTGNVYTHNNNGYGSGCRCDICREAHRIYNRQRTAKTRAELAHLREHGNPLFEMRRAGLLES